LKPRKWNFTQAIFIFRISEGIAEICRIRANKGISLIYETVSPIPTAIKLMKTVGKF